MMKQIGVAVALLISALGMQAQAEDAMDRDSLQVTREEARLNQVGADSGSAIPIEW